MKIRIDNVYLLAYGEDNYHQAYFLSLDLMNDTEDNVRLWDDFLLGLDDGEPFTITIERK